MKGAAIDVKRELALLLQGPAFGDQLARVVAERGEGLTPPIPLPSSIYREETLAHMQFPMVELIAYRVNYPDNDVVVHAHVEIGVRWTAVAADEKTVTRHVEQLVETTVALLWGLTLPNVNSGPILIREEDYSPLLPTTNHPFMKSAAVLITVPIWRTFS